MRVIDSRDHGDEIRRRRKCLSCGTRWTTYESSFQQADLIRDCFNQLKDEMHKVIDNLHL
jgi:transcriptional regulator NrdR family protein